MVEISELDNESRSQGEPIQGEWRQMALVIVEHHFQSATSDLFYIPILSRSHIAKV